MILQTCRVGLFLLIIWCVHNAHANRVQTSSPQATADVPPAVLTDLYGEGADLATDTGEVLGVGGESLGRVLQTSPEADHIVGFSGPTNVLLALDAADRIVGWHVLASEDTREHVQQVVENPTFLDAALGLTVDEFTTRSDFDAVSGATLTSLAIIESLQHRLGGGLTSLRFPEEPTIGQIQELFPEAARMEPDRHRASWWDLFDETGQRIGGLLRTSPAADNIVGYQGPTETLIGFNPQGSVTGLVVGESYDNEPYVGYIREDRWYRNSFNGHKLWELGELDLEEAGVEGVSGATMTSMAIAEGMVAAAARNRQPTPGLEAGATRSETSWRIWPEITARNWGTIAVLLGGLAIGMTSLRGRGWLRIVFQAVLIGYLGFVNGDLISQAMLVGWAKNGVPWESMMGVFLLTVAAFIVPIATKRNVYCHHLCPHGAAQQWLRPSKRRQVHLPNWLDRLLLLIPAGLLLLVVAVAMGALSMSLVDIEPFDAYLITIAGAATITIAVVGLIASAFVPMAYCRYGCPTGAVIEYVRRHARSDRLTPRDAVALGCLALAWWLS